MIAEIRLSNSDEPYAEEQLNEYTKALVDHGSWRGFLLDEVTGIPATEGDWEGLLADPRMESAAFLIRLLYQNNLERVFELLPRLEQLDSALVSFSRELGAPDADSEDAGV